MNHMNSINISNKDEGLSPFILVFKDLFEKNCKVRLNKSTKRWYEINSILLPQAQFGWQLYRKNRLGSVGKKTAHADDYLKAHS